MGFSEPGDSFLPPSSHLGLGTRKPLAILVPETQLVPFLVLIKSFWDFLSVRVGKESWEKRKHTNHISEVLVES